MERYRDWDDAALLIAFKNGSIAAFEEIYSRYWFRLYSVAFKQTESKQESEEMVQTVFERIWKNRDTIAVNNIGAYLTISIRNIIIDFARKQSIHKKHLAFLHSPNHLDINNGEESLELNQLINRVEALLNQLPEKTRMVFKLSRYEEKSVKEIAAQLQISEKGVEYHISKSLKLLKHHLKNYLHFFL